MNTLEILKAARAIIVDEKNFTQGAFARDSEGDETDVCDPYSCKFCSLGAMGSLKNVNLSERFKAVTYLEDFFGQLVADFNDKNPHAVVIAGWDGAIAKLEATE
jgi:hypothetical protein